ncbi:MAG: T9SS type A sorting domain-containing protein [Bacteroidia bacterium]
MKKILILLCLLTTTGFAQSLSPDVISSSGNSFSDGTSQLDWTLGETATSSFATPGNIVTQGFQQPELLVTAINAISDPSISAFPNPTSNILNVKITDPEHTIIELYTTEGRLLQSSTAISKDVLIDMSTYAAGTYLLVIKEQKHKTASYKISKTN